MDSVLVKSRQIQITIFHFPSFLLINRDLMYWSTNDQNDLLLFPCTLACGVTKTGNTDAVFTCLFSNGFHHMMIQARVVYTKVSIVYYHETCMHHLLFVKNYILCYFILLKIEWAILIESKFCYCSIVSPMAYQINFEFWQFDPKLK